MAGVEVSGVVAERAERAIREEAHAEGVLMGGWGEKQGGRVKSWKRRWFTLRRCRADEGEWAGLDPPARHVLAYRKKKGKEMGSIPLSDRTRVTEIVHEGRGLCMSIRTPPMLREYVVEWGIPASLGGSHGRDDPIFKACVHQVWATALANPETALCPPGVPSAPPPAGGAEGDGTGEGSARPPADLPATPPPVVPWVPPSNRVSRASTATGDDTAGSTSTESSSDSSSEDPDPDSTLEQGPAGEGLTAEAGQPPDPTATPSALASGTATEGGCAQGGDEEADPASPPRAAPAQTFAIKEAGGLPLDFDEGGADKAPDPYVKVTLDGSTLCTTPTKKNTRAPRWVGDNVFEVAAGPADRTLVIELWDWDRGLNHDDKLGSVTLTVGQLTRMGRPGYRRPLTLNQTGGYPIWLALHRLGAPVAPAAPETPGTDPECPQYEVPDVDINTNGGSDGLPKRGAAQAGGDADRRGSTESSAYEEIDRTRRVAEMAGEGERAEGLGTTPPPDVHDVEISASARRSLATITSHLRQALWCLRECHEIALDQTRRPVRRGYKFSPRDVDLLAQKFYYLAELREQFETWRGELLKAVDEDKPEPLDTLVTELRKVVTQVKGDLGEPGKSKGKWDQDLFGFKTSKGVRRGFALYMRMVETEMTGFVSEGDALLAEVGDEVAPEAKEAERDLILALPTRLDALGERVRGLRGHLATALAALSAREPDGRRRALLGQPRRRKRPVSPAIQSLHRFASLLGELLQNDYPGKPAFSKLPPAGGDNGGLELFLAGPSTALALCQALKQLLLPLLEVLGNLVADGVDPADGSLSAARGLADAALASAVPSVDRVARRCLPYVLEAKAGVVTDGADLKESNLARLLRGDDFVVLRPQQAFLSRLQARRAQQR